MRSRSLIESHLWSGADLRIETSFLMGDVTRRLRAMYDNEMKDLGLSRAQWRALIFVLRLGSPSQTELADALDIGRASTGALIDQLETSGFAARVIDPKDRRIWRVSPTKAALNNLRTLNDAANKVAEKAFDGLSEQELSVMHALLSKLKDNIDLDK